MKKLSLGFILWYKKIDYKVLGFNGMTGKSFEKPELFEGG